MSNSDTPETIAYRITQVENAVKELTKKIDGVISGFATNKDIEAAKQQAKLEMTPSILEVNSLTAFST